MGARPLVLAHRGTSGYAPKNTLAAFDLAFEMGVPGVETDVQATADGRLVLLNDERVDRAPDGHGLVASLTLTGVGVGRWLVAGGGVCRSANPNC